MNIPKGLQILDKIIKKIQKLKGGILFIDYGYLELSNDTLQSLKSHKKIFITKILVKLTFLFG